jgi:hypothetical protein
MWINYFVSSIDYLKKYYIFLIIIILYFLYGNYPIFPDEITNNYLATNASSFNGKAIGLIDSCMANRPFIPFIVDILKTITTNINFFVNSLYSLRIFSLFLGFVVFIYLWYFLIRTKKNEVLLIAIISWPLVFLPIFVINRPEIYIILSISALSIFIDNTNKKFKYIHFYIGIIAYAFALNYHPKSLFFLPLVVFALYKTRSNYFLIVSFLIFLTYLSISYFKHYNNSLMYCGHDYIKSIISAYQINPVLFFSEPFRFFNSILSSNNSIITDRAISQLMIRNGYDIGFIPNIVKSFWLWNIINASFIISILYILLNILRNKKSILQVILIFICTTIFLLNANKAPYDMSMYVVILVIIASLVPIKK